MSDATAQQVGALGTSVKPTVLPADVRASGQKGVQLYQAALGFEQMLTSQLTAQLAQTMQGTDQSDGGDGSGDGSSEDPSTTSIFPSADASTSMYGQMLPQALSNGLTEAGGLGVAHSLWLMLARQTGLSLGPTGSDSAASAGGSEAASASTAPGA